MAMGSRATTTTTITTRPLSRTTTTMISDWRTITLTVALLVALQTAGIFRGGNTVEFFGSNFKISRKCLEWNRSISIVVRVDAIYPEYEVEARVAGILKGLENALVDTFSPNTLRDVGGLVTFRCRQS